MNEEVAGSRGEKRGKVSIYAGKLGVLLCIVGMALVVAGESGTPKSVGLLILAVVGATHGVIWATARVGAMLRPLGGEGNG